MHPVQLQVALDLVLLDEAVRLAEELDGVAEILEIGTPLIFRQGISAVTAVKQANPQMQVLADLKIMDGGALEATIAFEAGADIVTVLGVAHNSTIAGAVREARKHGRKVMADLIAVADIAGRAKEVEQLGVDYVCVHTAFDIQESHNPLAELTILSAVVPKEKRAVAGGVKLSTLNEIIQYCPEIVVVGGAITNQPDRRAAALEIKRRLIADGR